VSDRQALHVLLSEGAHRGMREFAESHGVSLSALVESIGLMMATTSGSKALDDIRTAVISQARQIDASRRVRTR
jgi:hypothetical protein